MGRMWSNLPEDLLEEILHKLPIDSLGRFRVVCSNWNQLLRSRKLLQRYETVHQLRGYWILRLCERSNCAYNLRPWYMLNKLHKSCRCSQIECISRSSWTFNDHDKRISMCISMPSGTLRHNLLSDGGLICYDGNVFNPITGSTRHLPGTGYDNWDKNSLKLCAFDVDNTNGVYQVFLIASNRHLLIYDSKANSWRRARESPIFLGIEVPGIIVNSVVYFMTRLKVGKEMKILHYDLRKDRWSLRVISWYWNWQVHQRHLFQWQNCVYLVSMPNLMSRVWVYDITDEGAGRFTPEIVCTGNFDDLLVERFSVFDLHSVRAHGNSINFFIIGREISHPRTLSCQRILYDLHTQEWSLAEKSFNVSKWDEIFVGFEPKLSNLA